MNALHRTLQKLADEAVKKQKQRNIKRWVPHFHVAPPAGWLNDPNGLCEYEGTYYAFFQMSPFEVNGGLKFWGLCTSKDLIRWEYQGTPLLPDQPFDCHGAYSGSTLVEDGVMYVYYTGNVKLQGDYDYVNNGRESNTVLAVSRDGRTFETKKLLMTNADYPWDLTCHVRDPKVWKQDRTYYMVQGARTKEDKGVVLVFSSEDKEHWKCIHRLQSEETFGFMWECPDLYELDGHTILCISPQGLQADGWKYRNRYQTVAGVIRGDFRTDGIPGEFQEIDGGFDFYAPQTFVDSTGRRILIGWMGMADAFEQYTNKSAEDGWQNVLTLPRELSVRGGVLCQNPVRELGTFWKQKEQFEGSFEKCCEIDCYELKLHPKEGSWKVTLSKGLELSFDPEEKLFRMEFIDHELGCGRTVRGREVDKVTDARIIVDASCVEVFLNGGKDVFSTRFYPEPGNYQVEIQGEHVTGDFLTC